MAKAVDWTAVETLIVDSATKQLAAFAKDHATDEFYGAIFDVETYDGASVSLLLNTEEHLKKEWNKPLDKKDLHRRFMPGSFAHTLPLTKGLRAFPAAEIEALVDEDMENDTTDAEGNWLTACKFLDAVCAAAVTLEANALATLSRTDDFTISVTPDASEPGDEAVKRYAKYKKRLAKAGDKRASSPSLKKSSPKLPSKPSSGH